MLIDFNHIRGNGLADQMTSILQEKEILQPIEMLKPKFTKDGNQYCFLYGENLQEGIAGFGETPHKAALDFNKNWYSETIKSQEESK